MEREQYQQVALAAGVLAIVVAAVSGRSSVVSIPRDSNVRNHLR
jgi:hypothetical protein